MPHPVQNPGSIKRQQSCCLPPFPSKSVDIPRQFCGYCYLPVRSRYDGYHAIFSLLPGSWLYNKYGYILFPILYRLSTFCQSDKIGLFLTVFIHKDTRLGGLLRKISDIVAFPVQRSTLITDLQKHIRQEKIMAKNHWRGQSKGGENDYRHQPGGQFCNTGI